MYYSILNMGKAKIIYVVCDKVALLARRCSEQINRNRHQNKEFLERF